MTTELPSRSRTAAFIAIAMLFALTLVAIPPAAADGVCALRTHTQEEWGTSSRDSNPASYRVRHFAVAFPAGARIGDIAASSVLFTSSAKVQAFLPATGAAGALAANATDPTATGAGALAGETLAMMINVRFDRENASFALADTALGDATLTAGECAGMTVDALLAQANRALAGMVTPLSPSLLSGCLALANGNAGVLSCDASAASNATPLPSNQAQNATSNATVRQDDALNATADSALPNAAPAFSLRVARWYPKVKADGTHYVLICDTTGVAPARYDWRFGDGEKLLGIRNGDVYHIFKRSGVYTITCGAANSTANSSMVVTVA